MERKQYFWGMKGWQIVIVLVLVVWSCGSGPKGSFLEQKEDIVPDYSKEENWSALPWRVDGADETPAGLIDGQADAEVDVFYVHPTTYFGERKYDRWNAPIKDEEINKGIDEYVIKNQASVFNKAGKVYAPRYRQAHIKAYSHKDTVSAKRAFDLAYEDVKNAFGYYMSHWNKGRPFIIASHSQGTTHTSRLIEEFIDGKPLESKMVAAYLIGIPVDLDRYTSLKPCQDGEDINCLIGWRTWKIGAHPALLKLEEGRNALITNPLSWTTDTTYVSAAEHQGSVLFDFYAEPIKNVHSAQIYKSILWTNKPKFKGSFLYRTKNYHRGDINLFYVNIRENAADRVKVFLGNK